MPEVSLILPCYNHAALLERAVASCHAQRGLMEILIVDDHSVDRSLEIAHKLAAVDDRVRVLQTDRNLGPGGARNAGVRAARGSHVSFLDTDDELIGTFFGDALDLMVEHPPMLAVKGEMEFFDPIKGYVLPEFDPRYGGVALSSSCGMVIDRGTFLRLGGFPEDPIFRGPLGGEDVAFMEAVIKYAQPIGRIERPCYRVWSQAGSHVDKFLANTRLKGANFEFIHLHPDQTPEGRLAQALKAYHVAVATRVAAPVVL
jgi:glycosyltransferase involved in cell wall biosynthesis